MTKVYKNFFNGIRHDDGDKIVGFERRKTMLHINADIVVDFYIIKLKYKDGTYRYIRTYCEHGTSDKLVEQEIDDFFVKRLFGKDGLIVKEGRNDYIYLGGINKRENKDTYRYSRYNKASNGESMQQLIDKYLNENIFPALTFKNIKENFDVFNADFFYHSGDEEMNEVFREGLRSRYGNVGRLGFASLTSTFYPSNSI